MQNPNDDLLGPSISSIHASIISGVISIALLAGSIIRLFRTSIVCGHMPFPKRAAPAGE
jgi:hypothetical protein